ncbi:MAG: molybdate ABC transporter substrate-binding protein [Eubacteriales bacterium]|nr:molybdate ABC transporter substrate-binding protein [Eubacteriales bacterium]
MKKQIAVMMAAVMAAGLMSGCGGSGKSTETESAAAEAQTEETAAEAETADGAETADAARTEAAAADAGEPVELIVFAAASMTETLNEIAEMYKEAAPNVTLTYTFDSSGTLKTQIQEGADCDVFISAAQKQMNQLDKDADPSVNTEGLDFVLEGSRFNLVENKVVLAVPDDNPAGIESFADLGTDKLNLICLGNDDVPVGAYSTEILTNLNILDKLESESKITYGSNVKEVTTQVKEGAVDCGIIYATDAFSAGLNVVDEAGKDLCKQVIYPAAVLNISKHPEEAKAFLEYLKTDDCAAVFESVGFSMAE